MKYKIIILTIICTIFGFSLHAQDGKIELKITNIESENGKIVVALFNNKKSFLEDGKSLKTVRLDISNNEVNYTFDNLELGEYAIAIYHDENNDNKCNRNWLGIPKEGYGFSTNYRPKLRAPHYDEVKINIEGATKVEIKMIN